MKRKLVPIIFLVLSLVVVFLVQKFFYKPRVYVNSIGMKFIRIEPGSFSMGSKGMSSGDEAYHKVRITRPYAIQSTELTVAQWYSILGEKLPENSCRHCPITKVSWDEVNEFVTRLNEKVGCSQSMDSIWKNYDTPADKNSFFVSGCYRLPTEAEWEFAARARTQGGVHFFDEGGKLEKFGWYVENSGNKVKPVAQLEPNQIGLYDVYGNAWELVYDRFEQETYTVAPKVNPLTKPHHDAKQEFVIRGGSSAESREKLTSANKHLIGNHIKKADIGFRLVVIP